MDQKYFGGTPFALSGDRDEVPLTTVDGSVSYTTGFGEDYSRDLGSDPLAKPIRRLDWNGIMYDVTEAIGALQLFGYAEWVSAADNGGIPVQYGENATVIYRADPGDPFLVYRSLTDANIAIPTDPASWVNITDSESLRADLADADDPAKGAALVGYKGRTIRSRLDDYINVRDYGAVGDYDNGAGTGADDTAAFMAALTAADLQNKGGIYVPGSGGDYLVTSRLNLEAGMAIIGDGAWQSTIRYGGLTGAAVRIRGFHCRIENICINSTTARTAAADTGGYGVWQEALDIAGAECKFCVYRNIRIENQPRHGLVLASGFMAAKVESSQIAYNGGHGILIDNGALTGRTNVSRPGGVLIENSVIHTNTGHSVKGGNGTGTLQTSCYRVIVLNTDTFRNALAAGVRSSNHGMHITGENCMVIGSALCGYTGPGSDNPTTGGIWVAGKGIFLDNNRYIQVVGEAVEVGNVVGFSTEDIGVRGLFVTGSTQPTLNPAIKVNSAARGVTAECHTPSFITRLVDSAAVQYYSNLAGQVDTDWINNTRQIVRSGIASNGNAISLSDDQAGYVQFSGEVQGVILISGSSAVRGAGMVFFRAGATGTHATLLNSGGATLTTGTGSLASGGTGGTDGSLNVFADTATNRLYIKNRTGAAGNYNFTLLNVTPGVTANDVVLA